MTGRAAAVWTDGCVAGTLPAVDRRALDPGATGHGTATGGAADAPGAPRLDRDLRGGRIAPRIESFGTVGGVHLRRP